MRSPSFEWSSSVIGYESSERYEPAIEQGAVALVGAGADIGGHRDEFFYLYTRLPEDGALTVRLWDFAQTHEWSKAGVMLRNGLDPGSANVMVYVSGANGALLQGRMEDGASTSSIGQDADVGPKTWLRLGRWGDEVVGEYSTNGFDWRQLGRYTLKSTGNDYIGLAVASHVPVSSAKAEFTDITVRRGDMGTAPAPVDVEVTKGSPGAPPSESTTGSVGEMESSASDAWVCGKQPILPSFRPTLFVAPDGSDSNDGRSESHPVRSLRLASSLARAGDVVWVQGGVYSADVIFAGQGTEEKPIVFESYPGECAIIDGSGLEADQHVLFKNASHYVFRNFEVRNSRAQGIHLVDSNNILVSHVRSHHNGLSGIQNVRGRDNQFTHFLVHDNSDGHEGDADGIGISSGSGMRVDHCVAFRNSDDGIDVWKSIGTVVEYCVAFENGFQGGDGNGFKAGGGLRNGNALIRFNISFSNKTQGFTYNSGDGIRFENNTSYNNGGYGFVAANDLLIHNLSFDNKRGDWEDYGGNRQVANSWNLQLSSPRFASIDPHSADFLALAADSPAIGKASGSTGSDDLGAIPYGETIESFMGINLQALLSR